MGMVPAERVYVLDFLRVVAALMVCVYHFFHIGSLYGTGVFFDSVLVKYGYLGVSLFFIISGFVISQSAEGSGVKGFIIGRFSRLYPTIFLGGIFTIIFVGLIDGFGKLNLVGFSCNLTMALPLCELLKVKYIDSSYWSLSVEIIFYALVAGGILIRDRVGIRLPLNWALFLWLILSSFYFSLEGRGFGLLGFSLILKYAPLFVAGMVFHYVYRNGCFAWADVGVLVFSYVLSLMYACNDIKIISMANEAATYRLLDVAAIITVFYAIFAMISVRLFELKTKVFIVPGAVTYALYVIHQMVGYTIIKALVAKTGMNAVGAAIVALVVVVFFAYLLMRVSAPSEAKIKKLIVRMA